MAEFNQNDFRILVIMSLAVIIMSFVFPAMGFTSMSTNETDIPSFNASQSQISFVNEPPEPPSNPNQGTLTWYRNNQESQLTERTWLDTDNYAISVFDAGDQFNPQPRINLVDYTPSVGSNITWKYINQTEFKTLENWSYEVAFDNVEIRDDNDTISVDWEIVSQPENQGIIESIPVIGGLYEQGVETASTIMWIGQLIFHFMIVGLEMITNVFITLFTLITFLFTFMYWLLSTYSNIVTSAPSIVGVFIAIPGLVLSFEFGKLVLILVQTISDSIPLT